MKTNRIYLYLSILFTYSANTSFAQNDTVVSEKLFNDLIQKEFRQIVSPETRNGIGNYASFDPLATKVDFSGNIVMRNFNLFGTPIKADGNILAIKASGAKSDGVLGILSEKKWNNGVGIDLQYNIIRPSIISLTHQRSIENHNYISADYDSYVAFMNSTDRSDNFKKKMQLKHEAKLDSLAISLRKQRASIQVLISKLNIDKSLLESENSTPENMLSWINDSIALIDATEKLETMKTDSIKLFSLTENQVLNTALIYANKKSSELYDKIQLTGFRIHWISFGYGINNNSFKLMDPILSINQTFKKQSFLTQEARIQFNSYKKGQLSEENEYFSIWLKGSITDNFSSLTKIEIEEKQEDTIASTTRSNSQKYNVYSGTYIKNIKQLTFGIDYYKFLTGSTMAIHLFPKWIITENLEPQLNFGVGLLVPFKNNDKTKEIINAEFFMDASNLFLTNSEVEKDLFKRSSYGIRFTAPINFKNISNN